MFSVRNPYPMIAFLAVAIIEFALEVSWNRTYHGTGIPLYMRTLSTSSAAVSSGDPAVTVHPYNAEEYGLRTKQWRWFHYTPVLHGMARRQNGAVRITGYLNWWVILFLVVPFLYEGSHKRLFALSGLAIVMLCYITQVYRLSSFADRLGA